MLVGKGVLFPRTSPYGMTRYCERGLAGRKNAEHNDSSRFQYDVGERQHDWRNDTDFLPYSSIGYSYKETALTLQLPSRSDLGLVAAAVVHCAALPEWLGDVHDAG